MKIKATQYELEALCTAVITMKWKIEADLKWIDDEKQRHRESIMIQACNNWIKAITKEMHDSPLNKPLHEN